MENGFNALFPRDYCMAFIFCGLLLQPMHVINQVVHRCIVVNNYRGQIGKNIYCSFMITNFQNQFILKHWKCLYKILNMLYCLDGYTFWWYLLRDFLITWLKMYWISLPWNKISKNSFIPLGFKQYKSIINGFSTVSGNTCTLKY